MPNKKKDMVMYKNKSSSFFKLAKADGVTSSGRLLRENKNTTIQVKTKHISEHCRAG